VGAGEGRGVRALDDRRPPEGRVQPCDRSSWSSVSSPSASSSDQAAQQPTMELQGILATRALPVPCSPFQVGAPAKLVGGCLDSSLQGVTARLLTGAVEGGDTVLEVAHEASAVGNSDRMIRVIHSCGSASSALASRPRNARTNQRQTPAHRHVSVTGFLLTGRGGRPGRTASGHFTRGTAQVTVIETYPRRPLLLPPGCAVRSSG
jgi:hypothetical protein